jgi:putative transposase
MEDYNNRPHDGLPTVTDPDTGKRRHVTPNEMWQMAEVEGWQASPISDAEAVDLFRPAVTRKSNRGLVNLFGNAYYHDALAALHGERVVVGFDLHDASKVWVRLKDGRFVCEAAWNGHKRAYLPVSVAQRALEQRVAGQLGRLDKHRDDALAQLPKGATAPREATPLTEDQVRKLEEMEAEWEEIVPEAEVTALLSGPSEDDLRTQLEAEMAGIASAPIAPISTPPAQELPANVVAIPVVHADIKRERFARALGLERQIQAGYEVSDSDAAWLGRYVIGDEYRACKEFYRDFGDDWLTG